MENELLQRICIDPEVCHGKPTIRDTRIMVESIIEYLASGDSLDDVLNEFPEIERNDILACLAFAARSVHLKNLEIPAA